MDIMISGSAGKLSQELLKLDWGNHKIIKWTREDADITDEVAVQRLIEKTLPDVIIHTASPTNLVKCEEDKQWAWDNIVIGTLNVAKFCRKWNIRMIFLSTDYIFRGDEANHPIPIDTAPNPMMYYGLCKLAAESAVRVLGSYCVIRTTIKDRNTWKHDVAPDDMWISPSYYDEVATYVQKMALSDISGIFHFAPRHVNVYNFAVSLRPDVKPVKRSDIKTLKLPYDVRLESSE